MTFQRADDDGTSKGSPLFRSGKSFQNAKDGKGFPEIHFAKVPLGLKALLFFFGAVVILGFTLSFRFLKTNSQAPHPVALEPPPLTEALFLNGKTLYEKQCVVCHGSQGAGDGRAAYLLYPKPRDFTRAEFRLISTLDMEATDHDLFKTITRGMPGSAMPSWDFLSEGERWSLVYYVRYLAEFGKKKASGEISGEEVEKSFPWEAQKELAVKKLDPEMKVKAPQEIPPTPERLEQGHQLFLKACASCHGPQGKGDGQTKMIDSLGLPLRPRDLTAGIFKGVFDFENLYYRIAAGLPGSSMPGYKDAFTDEQIADLIHYIETLPKKGTEERARVQYRHITARKSPKIEVDPLASEWASVEPVFVSLAPLWWRNERIEGVEVRALYDANELAVHLSWSDPTQDVSTVAPQSFSDGAAVEFSNEKNPPFFGMGEPKAPVTIWHWKAAWQEDLTRREDVETLYPSMAVNHYPAQTNYSAGAPFEAKDSKTPFHDPLFLTGHASGNPLSNPERRSAAEEARAEGLGTLTVSQPESSKVEARGIYKDGRWSVVFRRLLDNPEEGSVIFSTGRFVSVAFAVWDGSVKDRDGQKNVSVWNELTLE